MNNLKKVENLFSDNGISTYIITNISDVYYLSGFTGTTAYVIFDSGDFIFVTDGRYETQAKNEIKNIFKIVIVDSYRDYFSDYLSQKENITVSVETPLDFYLLVSEKSNVNVDKKSLVSSFRQIKSDEEVDMLRQSYHIAATAFTDMLEGVDYNMPEGVWAAKLEYNMKILGADSISFDTIIASGQRSGLPHGRASSKIIKKGEPVIIDYGCKKNYCSDITRVVLDSSNKQVLDVIDIVYTALKKATDTVKPGVKCCDVDAVARDYIHHKGYGKYFNHGLGHGVGIDVHEKPAFRQKDNTVLAPGMVLTIEPGIYLPDNFGIRLEDTILVTETGCEILSAVLDKYVYKIYS